MFFVLSSHTEDLYRIVEACLLFVTATLAYLVLALHSLNEKLRELRQGLHELIESSESFASTMEEVQGELSQVISQAEAEIQPVLSGDPRICTVSYRSDGPNLKLLDTAQLYLDLSDNLVGQPADVVFEELKLVEDDQEAALP